MAEHIFADGVASIAVVGDTVRLNFFVLVPAEKPGGHQAATAHHQVVMPLSSFLQATAKFSEAAEAIGKLRSGQAAAAAQPVPHPEGAGSSVVAPFPAKNVKPPFP